MDLWLNPTISSFKSRMRRPYAIPSAIEVANLKASLRGVMYTKVCNLTVEGLVRARYHLHAFRVKGRPPQVSAAHGNTTQPSHSIPCAEAIPNEIRVGVIRIIRLSVTSVFIVVYLAPSSPVITVRGADTTFSTGQDFVPTKYA
jgi:hypothetical protein